MRDTTRLANVAENRTLYKKPSIMNNLSAIVKQLRKQYNLTQEDLSLKSGIGLRFVRDLEQGKETLRLDKVNQLLNYFNYEMTATSKSDY